MIGRPDDIRRLPRITPSWRRFNTREKRASLGLDRFKYKIPETVVAADELRAPILESSVPLIAMVPHPEHSRSPATVTVVTV